MLVRYGPRRKPNGRQNLPAEGGEVLVKSKEWRGKGEATKGSEGLKKSEQSQGGLERQEQ